MLTLVGCMGSAGAPSAEGVAYVLSDEPDHPLGVIDLKALVTRGAAGSDEVALIGRVGGGQVETWDESQAAFVVRDLSLNIEPHHQGGDHDDCKFCQAEKASQIEAMAQVQIVDEDGNVVSTDARTLLGLKENHIVVAQGKGEVDEVGNFVFSATTVYVRR
jgi:hypothetical protein